MTSKQSNEHLLPTRNLADQIVDRLLDTMLNEPSFNRVSLRDQRRKLVEILQNPVKASLRLDDPGMDDTSVDSRTRTAIETIEHRLASTREQIKHDITAAVEGDPACVSRAEAALAYPGVRVLAVHRIAHQLHRHRVLLLARLISESVHASTGIDIHPGASIGRSFFIDHGTGVVIGETAIIGDHCTLYQGVTLGARSIRNQSGQTSSDHNGAKRHPTLEDHVVIYAGATILGGDTVIGVGSVVGAGVFLDQSVPPRHVVSNQKPVIQLRPNRNQLPLSFAI